MIISYNDYLEHYGRKGMHWYQHIYGEEDSRGKYNKKKSPLGDEEDLTEATLNKYKSQYSNLRHIRIDQNTKGKIWTKDGKVQAMVNTEKKDDGDIWIQGLELFGDSKGKGLSKDVLNYAVNELGATKLSVRKTNTIAKHLYDKNNWKTYDETDSMYFMEYKKQKSAKHSISFNDYLDYYGS